MNVNYINGILRHNCKKTR